MNVPARWLLLSLALVGGVQAAADEPLTLWEAMKQAAEVNPAIRSQQVEVARQVLEQDIARSQHYPKIDLSGGYTHFGYPTLVTPIRQAGVFPSMDKDISSLGVALNLPLYSGGKLVAGEALAAQHREAAVQALRASGQDLLFNVVAAYAKAIHFKELRKTLDSRIGALQQEEKDIELRIGQGRAARLELIRLQTQLSQARHDGVVITQGEKDALSLLASLMGGDHQAPALAGLGKTAPNLPGSVEEAVDLALRQRPDLLRLEAMGKAADAKTDIARGDRLPQISLVAKAQKIAGSDSRVYNDWQMGLQLSVPLFDGAIRRRRVAQASLELRQSHLVQQDARNHSATEIQQAFGTISEARARLEVATQGESESGEVLRIETLRYDSGESTITDLLIAESVQWGAAASRLQAEYDITISQARLLRAIGELAPGSFKPVPEGGGTAVPSSPGGTVGMPRTPSDARDAAVARPVRAVFSRRGF